MKRSRNLLLIIIAVMTGLSGGAFAQCCSPGNPVSGSEYAGIVPKKELRTITYYRHSYSDTYFEESEVSDFQGTISGYDFIGAVVSYGIIDRLAAELELGYYLTKFQDSDVLNEFKTHGFNNAVISAKYAVVRAKNDLEITLGAGAKLPVTRKIFRDEYGVPFPQEIQPSTGAFGFVGQMFVYKSFLHKKFRVILLGRYEMNGYNSEDYRFGDAIFASVFLGWDFAPAWSATIQLRNEYRMEDWQGETRYLATGGDILFLSPQISYTIIPKLTVSLTGDVPVFRHYNGIQMGPKYALGISLIKEFCF